MNSLFYELIRVSIGTQDSLSHIPSESEWAELYDIATKQSLVGICFAGIQRLVDSVNEYYYGMSMIQYLTWTGISAKIQQWNEMASCDCERVEEMFEAKGYWTCIIKGQRVARYYGRLSPLRQSGDIDIWAMPRELVQEGDCAGLIARARKETIRRILKEEPDRIFWPHHIDYTPKDSAALQTSCGIEVHFTPSTIFDLVTNRKVQRYFERNIHRSEHALPPDVDVVFQLMHLRKHLISEGVGMRQVIDLYMTLRALRKECGNSWKTKRGELMATIRDLRMESFTAGMMWVLETVFFGGRAADGVKRCDDLLLCDGDAQRGNFILGEIAKGGNFGKHNKDLSPMGDSPLSRTWFFTKLALRNVRYFPAESLWNPVYRLCTAIWKRWMRYETR